MRLVRGVRYVVAITLMVVGIGFFAVHPKPTTANAVTASTSYPFPTPGGYPPPSTVKVVLPWVVVDVGSTGYPGPVRVAGTR